ncbi:hypothetical protein RND71_005870 [Anisodus tanguticus]|uniref:Uncharacterized protein n=1 Tax=Anisodus tanguticus TaxID=243964 RepID=A0AAE1SPU7_9SOLA|nr:hypothetical protein RND71_005870 [Anisodus tanguticus]
MVETRNHQLLNHSREAIIEEKSDGRYVNGEESNTHEDKRNQCLALLSDGIEGDEDDYDDEVTSADRSPCANQGCYGCGEEVASSDGTYNRQRLLDGGYKKPSSIESKWPDDEDDVEVRSVRGSLPPNGKDKDSSLSTREGKLKFVRP